MINVYLLHKNKYKFHSRYPYYFNVKVYIKNENSIETLQFIRFLSDCVIYLGNKIRVNTIMYIAGNARIGDNTKLGSYVRLGKFVKVGSNCNIGHGVTILNGCIIENRSTIKDEATVYDFCIVTKFNKIKEKEIIERYSVI